MLKFNVSSFYDAIAIMRRAHTKMEDRKDNPKPISAAERRTAPKIMNTLRTRCEELGVRVTELAVTELVASIKRRNPALTNKQFFESLMVINATLRRELSLINVFVLDGKSHDYFDPRTPLFGTEFESKFPSAVYELDEAGKCLALSRPTAAVFHLMRIMEVGIRSIARCLKMSDPTKAAERNWGAILKNIKGEIDSRTANSLWANLQDREFFERCHASLDSVRVAWRNTTMHIENKYSPEEAEHIFGAVKGFMKQLSSRCDELGIFHA